METVVGVGIQDNGDGKLGDTGVDRDDSALSSSKQIANPVMYKLVRIKGDGSLVPVTDDEVMEVEDFLNHNSEMCAVAGTEQSVKCISIERPSSGKLQLECSEGLSHSDTAVGDRVKLNARLQYIEKMLQKVKEEEKLHLARRSPVHSYINIGSPCSANNLSLVDGKIQSNTPMQKIMPYLRLSLNDSHSNQSGIIGPRSRPSEELIESRSSGSAVCSTLKPDIFMSDREVCLNNLSISELHELFKVTFGQETNIKDKQWLKRRITRSLTNSSDVSTNTFIVRDDKLVDKLEEDSCGNVTAVLFKATDGEEDINAKDSSIAKGNEVEDNQFVSGKRHRSHDMEHELGSGDHHTELRAAKNIQKLTRRYVKELFENESRDHNPSLLSLNKNIIFKHDSSNSYIRPARNSFVEGRTVVTRLDSLGGSKIHIPCVSRLRRSRPRKNILSLMTFLPIGMGEAEKLSNKVYGVSSSQTDSGSQDKVLKSRTPGKLQQSSSTEAGKHQQYSVMGTELRQELILKKVGLSTPNYNSDDNNVTVPTNKGGVRRKHHRAWTLAEVLKLVEGVSKCGPGRWSEIKRLAFASYSYRTSVDLKDKWRNLLKASFAQAPADEGINSRKHVPIPKSILVRVRELAEMNSQLPPSFTSSDQKADAVTVCHDNRLRY